MFKSFVEFNEYKSDDWLVKCLTLEEREEWLDDHYYESLSQEEIDMFCDFVDKPDDNEPNLRYMRLFKKHARYPKPEINDVSIRYYFATGAYMEFEKMEDEWYYIQTDIIRQTRYFVVDGKLGFEKFKSMFWTMREGTTDLVYDENINESKVIMDGELYREITCAKYSALKYRDEPMSKSEKNIIISELESFDIKCEDRQVGIDKRNLISGYEKSVSSFTNKVITKSVIAVSKIDDDYFILRLIDIDRYYMCDTIDGVVELIWAYFN